jgi:plasmid stabilization system protein ParE
LSQLQIHPDAQLELIAQVAFYEEAEPGLGEEFLDEVEAVVRRIQRMPGSGGLSAHGTRSLPTKRFPFVVVHLETAEQTVVVAVSHMRRKPSYWRARASK